MGQSGKIVTTGIVLSLLVLFLGSICVYAQPFGILSSQAQQKPHKEILSSANGRFVFGQISDSSKDQFMLDTLSGRLWRIAESSEVGLFLRTVPYRTADGKYSPIPKEISDAGTKEVEKK